MTKSERFRPESPLARICNPYYDFMARIATNGHRPTGDKYALADLTSDVCIGLAFRPFFVM